MRVSEQVRQGPLAGIDPLVVRHDGGGAVSG
jgi:hypothetical protein